MFYFYLFSKNDLRLIGDYGLRITEDCCFKDMVKHSNLTKSTNRCSTDHNLQF